MATLNTHCHGDHSGGNAYLVERAGVKVYAPLCDAVVLRQPVSYLSHLHNRDENAFKIEGNRLLW